MFFIPKVRSPDQRERCSQPSGSPVPRGHRFSGRPSPIPLCRLFVVPPPNRSHPHRSPPHVSNTTGGLRPESVWVYRGETGREPSGTIQCVLRRLRVGHAITRKMIPPTRVCNCHRQSSTGPSAPPPPPCRPPPLRAVRRRSRPAAPRARPPVRSSTLAPPPIGIGHSWPSDAWSGPSKTTSTTTPTTYINISQTAPGTGPGSPSRCCPPIRLYPNALAYQPDRSKGVRGRFPLSRRRRLSGSTNGSYHPPLVRLPAVAGMPPPLACPAAGTAAPLSDSSSSTFFDFYDNAARPVVAQPADRRSDDCPESSIRAVNPLIELCTHASHAGPKSRGGSCSDRGMEDFPHRRMGYPYPDQGVFVRTLAFHIHWHIDMEYTKDIRCFLKKIHNNHSAPSRRGSEVRLQFFTC